ncbi:hypothetical protein [Inquilinus sp. OTU3971]|uniref:hypothetical protein n=1 Tax=Inquilinus sp. OTU3971 TaxID=3043855 RepID=UPI00313BAC9D
MADASEVPAAAPEPIKVIDLRTRCAYVAPPSAEEVPEVPPVIDEQAIKVLELLKDNCALGSATGLIAITWTPEGPGFFVTDMAFDVPHEAVGALEEVKAIFTDALAYARSGGDDMEDEE